MQTIIHFVNVKINKILTSAINHNKLRIKSPINVNIYVIIKIYEIAAKKFMYTINFDNLLHIIFLINFFLLICCMIDGLYDNLIAV